eukprot:TRINITY_DN65808_c0_g1_i1.p1 TRINITY_DN65808_c0_g1~~TRINITY_DN65808_c0_g1_i1.p1  ORF type:complete len:677 (+),score=107.32 TRINITY_DN65808_c0_g1_i1:135-2165(+)
MIGLLKIKLASRPCAARRHEDALVSTLHTGVRPMAAVVMRLCLLAAVCFGRGAASRYRLGPDRWMSSWTWSADGGSLVFTFSGLESSDSASDVQQIVPALQMRAEAAAVDTAIILRGWTRHGCRRAGWPSSPSWHHVRVSDLKLESGTYLYRFGLDTGAGGIVWLVPERRLDFRKLTPESRARFIVVADSHGGFEWEQTIEGIEDNIVNANDSDPYAAFLDLGDISPSHCINDFDGRQNGQGSESGGRIVDTSPAFKCGVFEGGYREVYSQYLADQSRATGIIPQLFIAGNHELDTCALQDYLARADALPYADSGSGTPYYWASQLGPVYVVSIFSEIGPSEEFLPQLGMMWGDGNVLDWGESERMTYTSVSQRQGRWRSRFEAELLVRAESPKFSQQIMWLDDQLRKAWNLKRDGQVSWIVLLSHRNARSGGYCTLKNYVCMADRGREDDIFLRLHRMLERLYYKYEVDLHLSGHNHVYERTYPVYNFIHNPPGEPSREGRNWAPVYVVAPRSGGQFLKNLTAPTWMSSIKPEHVAHRQPVGYQGWMEFSASPAELRLELYGAETGDKPSLLDHVTLSSAGQRDPALLSKMLGGDHLMPTGRREEDACRAAITSGKPLQLVYQMRQERKDFAKRCLDRAASHGDRIMWRVVFDPRMVREAMERGPVEDPVPGMHF